MSTKRDIKVITSDAVPVDGTFLVLQNIHHGKWQIMTHIILCHVGWSLPDSR